MAFRDADRRTCQDCGCPRGQRQWGRCPGCAAARKTAKDKQRGKPRRACVTCGKQRKAHVDQPQCKQCLHKARRKLMPCPRCGVPFWPWEGNKHARKYCSKACAQPPRKPKQLKAKRPQPQPRECMWCLTWFVPRVAAARIRCCSTRCRGHYENKRRKARLRGVIGSPLSVYVLRRRDGNLCALCGQAIDFSLVYPHPGAATVDHTMPVTKGGHNDPLNQRLAHSRCNIVKGNRLSVAHAARQKRGGGVGHVIPPSPYTGRDVADTVQVSLFP